MPPGTDMRLPALFFHMGAAAQHLVEILHFERDMLEAKISAMVVEEQIVMIV